MEEDKKVSLHEDQVEEARSHVAGFSIDESKHDDGEEEEDDDELALAARVS
jgi:hypothetical protein